MFLVIEENPNCPPDERVFSESGPARTIDRLLIDDPKGVATWCEAAAVENGSFGQAKAVQVEDSSAGSAWLIFGGGWGVRFRPAGLDEDWALEDQRQWGAPFLVLDSSTDIVFKDA